MKVSQSKRWIVRAMLMASAVPGCAYAQEAPTAPDSTQKTPDSTQASDSGGTLSDIVITAQKRSENAQRVPITITTVSAERLAATGITSIEGLQQAVPGLKANTTVLGAQPFLRGIGYGSGAPGFESPTAILVDEVYSPSQAATLFSLNSVSRIEVLKGPQGTLFGRNAVAGAINVLTRNPTQEASVDADAEYGSFDTTTFRFYGNVPLSDSIAANIALYDRDQRKGWGRNVFSGGDLRKGASFDSRGKLRFQLGSKASFLLTGWYSHANTDFASFTVAPGKIGYNGFVFNGNFFDGANQYSPSISTLYGASGKFEYNFGWATLSDIAAYQKVKALFGSDSDGTPADVRLGTGGLYTQVDWKDRTFTNEFRLVSPGGATVNWTVGVYYLHQNTDPANLTLNGAATPSVVSKQVTNSIAPFADLTFRILDGTRLTLGGRYNHDQREMSSNLTALKRVTFNKVTWRAALEQEITSDVRFFVSANRGYHAGSFSLQSPAIPVLKPEILDAYEAGIKSELFNHTLRLNGSVFLYDYKNVVLRSYPAGGTGGAVLSNAAAARIKGLDLDFEYAPVKRFTLAGGIEILDAKFTDWPLAAVTIHNDSGPLIGRDTTILLPNGAGKELTNSPHFSGNVSATYRAPSSLGEFSINAAYSYRSRMFWDPGNRLSEPPVGVVNASIVLTTVDHRWDFGVFATNLTNKKYFNQFTDVSNGDGGTVGAPRYVGVRVGLHY